MAKETAEQRLLKLIEETDGKTGGAAPSPAASAPSNEAQKVLTSVSSVGAIALPPVLQGLVNLLFKRPSPKTVKASPASGLKQLNQGLALLVAVMAGFFIVSFNQGLKSAQGTAAYAVTQGKLALDTNFLPVIKDLSDYVSVVSERNIFLPYEKKITETQVIAPVENQLIKDKVANLKVVGISWLSTAESATVMIEDQKTSITHFLRVGEDLDGLTVETIYADRVIVTYGGETLTINL